MDIVAAIEKALQQTGKSKSGLAKALGKHPNVVTNILKRERRVQLDELPLIKRYLELDLAAPSPEHGISIRGIVGAGDEFYADNADDPNEFAPPIANAGRDTVAVEIRGSSLGPALDGWLAYYDDRHEPMSDALTGKLCVVGLDDGRILIKIPRAARTPGTWHLFPNSGGDVIMDAKVLWAARVIELRPKG